MRSICPALAIVKFVNSFALIPPATSRPLGSMPDPLKTKVDKHVFGSSRSPDGAVVNILPIEFFIVACSFVPFHTF